MDETTPLVFYANRNCPYAQRSWITLLELSVDFEYQEISLGKDNKTEWFCALNPNGTVPVIKHGETVVYESLVVNEYLCEVFGGKGVTLMPSQLAARARARILMTRCDSKLVKLSYSYLSHKRTEDAAKDDQLRAHLEEELLLLDAAIEASGGPYFLGETVSLVDIAFMPFFERMNVALSAWKDFEIENSARVHLNTWLEAMSNRETYRQTRLSPERIKELYSQFLNVDYFKRVGVAL
ncbi:glutathione S-transferase family protein [Microcoleus sp. FACHB-SPT15]|uniref:glutathione S-transferase family protein n=1 Tax=Microcoleus sp. FACHB-SPT15 TaxID=2692830 RepID=UPI001784B012|nr:glutathione S-transferase family protein [Microcoleus sp. FACHB-SPT15]MBD1808508.1 glutathione S-transferase family protein [Microcoleus sp. FACHB-SPT15]